MKDYKLLCELTAFVEEVIKNARKRYIYNKKREMEKEEIVVNIYINDRVSEICVEDSDALFFDLDKEINVNNLECIFSEQKYYNAMKKMSNDDKRILYLFEYEEKSGEEVSKLLNISIDNAYKKRERARNRFKKFIMGDECDE